MAANQVVLYFEKPEDAFAFHSGCQFCNVSRRFGSRQQCSGQGCGGDLQSQSNHD